MSRGLASAITDELAKGQYRMAHLVKLELNTTYLYTDASFNITESGLTYLSNSFLLGLNGVKENSNINIGSFNLGISSVNQTILSDVLNNGHLNRQVTIKRAFLNTDNELISGAVFSIYFGRIQKMSIQESGASSKINFSVANHWSDFERTSGRKTNNSSQQHYFDEDLSMEFAPQAGEKLQWGDISEQPESVAQTSRNFVSRR